MHPRSTLQRLFAIAVLTGAPVVCTGADLATDPADAAADTPAYGTLPGYAVPDIVKADPEWDWIRLTSGEWLKGELTGLERDTLEFDSDELGDLEIDWDDIDSLYTHRAMALLLTGGRKTIGKLHIHNGSVILNNLPLDITRDDILRIALSAPREIDLWSGSITAGLSIRSGNVEERDLDTAARFTRRTAQSTARMSYTGNYTKTNDVESANNHRAKGSFDYRLSRSWFIRPLQAEYYRDKFQNIDSQWHVGFGASYYLIETNATLWTVSAGPGYQETTYFEVPPGDDRRVSSTTFLISTEYDQELTSTIDVYGAYDLTYANEESGGITQNLTLALDVDLIFDLDLNVTANIYHIESPQADASGRVPDNTDSRLTVGLSYDF